MYHWANLKLRKATVPANIALHLLTPKHPPKVKYFLKLQIHQIYTITVIVKHPPKEKYFQRQGQDQAVRNSVLTQTLATLRKHQLQRESHSDQQDSHSGELSETPSQSEISQYTENIVDSNSCSTSTSSQSEIYSYEAGSESSSRESSRPSSPEAGSHQNRSLYSPTPEMAIVTRSYHDAIHAVRDQQQRPVTRRLLKQQVLLASQKAIVNQLIKSSTPDPPKSNAMTYPRRSRARSGKANGVTGSSSEDSSQSDCNEPRTASQARFQALKRRFETPPKTEESGPSYGVAVKRQRLFRSTSSQSATDCPPASIAQRTVSRTYSGTSSEGDWDETANNIQTDQLQCVYCT